jgi:predicted component of type VI protein secretion system
MRRTFLALFGVIALAACGSPASGPHLTGTAGLVVGHTYPIAATGRTSIGRMDDCNVVIAGDETVSRHHAYFEAASGTVTLSDDSSTNGTFVNGARIQSQALHAGDVITLGAQSLRFDP